MTVIGKINRSGLTTKRVVTGPGELIGPSSLGKTVGFAEKAGIRGPVDLYEISDGSGANEGTYTITVTPYAEAGLPGEIRGIGKVALFQQTGGVASPTAAVTCVDTAVQKNRSKSITLGPAAIATGDKAWIAIERTGKSEIRYQISLDLVLDAITISAQPPNRTVAAPTGSTFTVTAATNDGGTLSYQWKISSDGGSTYSNVSNGGVYSGATLSTLTISDSTGLDGKKYRVVVSSSGGSPAATSDAGTFTVHAITITDQPDAASVTAPAAASFVVAATTNDGGGLSYQWKISSDGGSTYSDVSNGGVYSGATTDTLAISDSTGLDGKRYRCVITSSGTAAAVTTSAALLSVA